MTNDIDEDQSNAIETSTSDGRKPSIRVNAACANQIRIVIFTLPAGILCLFERKVHVHE
jgi:hypothetical protein